MTRLIRVQMDGTELRPRRSDDELVLDMGLGFDDDRITLTALREARACLPADLKGAIIALVSGIDCGGAGHVLFPALSAVVDLLDENVGAEGSIRPALDYLPDAIADLTPNGRKAG
jgi:hypothetical protein